VYVDFFRIIDMGRNIDDCVECISSEFVGPTFAKTLQVDEIRWKMEFLKILIRSAY